MNILGITHPISHNSSACLIKNGELISIGEEERFIREKHAPRVFPENSIKFCMELGNISPEDIDVVAVGFGEKNFCGGPMSGAMIKYNVY